MQSLLLFVARFRFALQISVISIALIITAISCGYKTPGTKTLAPDEELFEKDFFVTTDASTGQKKAKTFMCGWASLKEVGFIAEWTMVNKAHMMPTCNIQFQVEKNFLVGYQVNPSVADPTLWAKVITIPITNHCTKELVKDKYGRETKDESCNTTKDAPLARPFMGLSFSSMQLHDWAYEMLYGGTQVLAVRDLEKTTHNGKKYLGFTLSVTSPYFGRHLQSDIRWNFLEIEPESVATFPPRLYHDDNSVHFGALWGLGKFINGTNPISFVGRWDMRPEALPHNFCLNGFENDAQAKKVAIDTINDWNQVFERNGITPKGKQAFSWSERKYKHDFDLRCNSFTYVADERISAYSPLGIAMAQADVSNGKILWGGMVVYGGALKGYVESYRGRTANSAAPMGATFSTRENKFVFGANPLEGFKPMDISRKSTGLQSYQSQQFANELKNLAAGSASSVMNRFVSDLKKDGAKVDNIQALLKSGRLAELTGKMNDAFLRRQRMADGGSREAEANAVGLEAEELAILEKQLGSLAASAMGQNPETGTQILRSLEIADTLSHETREGLTHFMNPNNFTELLLGRESAQQYAIAASAQFGDGWSQMSATEKSANIQAKQENLFRRLHNSNVHDLDNTIADFVNDLRDLPADLKSRPLEDIIEVSLRKTFLHEFGHIVGLGHNFKENILPKEGTVPSSAYQKLRADSEKEYHQNAATIMGYPHSYQMVVKRVEDVQIGPQDELVLHYIYKNEYAVYSKQVAARSASLDRFEFRQVPNDGRIPSKDEDLGDGYRVSYFENCTDYMEWFGLDPYCNRWDRGHDAKTIVQGYLDDYDRNNIKKLENLTDSGFHPRYAEYYLWVRSLDSFSRVRKFYDHMRYKYRKEIRELGKGDSKNLYSFEKCNTAEQNNPAVKAMFERANPEFENLCEANLNAVRTMGKFLRDPGQDFTTYDNDKMAVSVNDMGNDEFQSNNRMNGTWQSLGVLPMKFSALLTLTATAPFRARGAWLSPVWKYAREGQNTKFTYASLYPAAFTQEIAQGIVANLKFMSDGNKSPQMGRVSLFTGMFLAEAFRGFNSTNDYQEFSGSYMKTLADQTSFIFDWENPMVPVVIQVVKDGSKNADPERVKSFNGFIYLWGNNSIQLGEVFMLPEGKVFFRGAPKIMVHPMSELFFIDDNLAVVWGIKVSYNSDPYSDIGVHGAKQQLYNRYSDIIKSCLDSAGLKDYFTGANPNFKGFKIVPGIAGNEVKYAEFTSSVQKEFDKYQAKVGKDNAGVCERALDDISLVVAQALSMIGAYLPQISQFISK